jgi:hypothetical protein
MSVKEKKRRRFIRASRRNYKAKRGGKMRNRPGIKQGPKTN